MPWGLGTPPGSASPTEGGRASPDHPCQNVAAFKRYKQGNLRCTLGVSSPCTPAKCSITPFLHFAVLGRQQGWATYKDPCGPRYVLMGHTGFGGSHIHPPSRASPPPSVFQRIVECPSNCEQVLEAGWALVQQDCAVHEKCQGENSATLSLCLQWTFGLGLTVFSRSRA